MEIPPEQWTPTRFTNLLDHVIDELETLKGFVGSWQLHEKARSEQLGYIRNKIDLAKRSLDELNELLAAE
jgi:hypothetical protein